MGLDKTMGSHRVVFPVASSVCILCSLHRRRFWNVLPPVPLTSQLAGPVAERAAVSESLFQWLYVLHDNSGIAFTQFYVSVSRFKFTVDHEWFQRASDHWTRRIRWSIRLQESRHWKDVSVLHLYVLLGILRGFYTHIQRKSHLVDEQCFRLLPSTRLENLDQCLIHNSYTLNITVQAPPLQNTHTHTHKY